MIWSQQLSSQMGLCSHQIRPKLSRDNIAMNRTKGNSLSSERKGSLVMGDDRRGDQGATCVHEFVSSCKSTLYHSGHTLSSRGIRAKRQPAGGAAHFSEKQPVPSCRLACDATAIRPMVSFTTCIRTGIVHRPNPAPLWGRMGGNVCSQGQVKTVNRFPVLSVIGQNESVSVGI